MFVLNFKKKYDFIMSIGQLCTTPEILKNCKLRAYSGPFDWTFVENYDVTIKVVKNKFENYFNKEDLVFLGYCDTSHMDVYRNKRTNVNHPHSFPSSKVMSFDDAYKIENKKYNRRIKRFFDFVNKKHAKICLLYIERAFDWEYKKQNLELPYPLITNEVLENDIKDLNKIYGRNCFDIFYIKHDSDKNLSEYKIDKHICYMNNSCIDENNPHKGNLPMLEKIILKHLKLRTIPSFVKKIKTTFCILKAYFC